VAAGITNRSLAKIRGRLENSASVIYRLRHISATSWFGKKSRLIGAISFLLPLAYFIGQVIAQSASRAPYSVRDQTISELGVTVPGLFTNPITKASHYIDSPLHAIMNASFILFGVGVLLGVWLIIRPTWPGRRLKKTGVILVGLCGPALVLAGLSPGDVRPHLHYVAGGFQFPAQNIGLILLGLAAIRSKPTIGAFTLLCGVVGMAGLVFQGTPPHVGLGYGGWQRVAAYPFAIWTITMGASSLTTYASRRSLPNHLSTP
jgi:hypothetical membrane protein